MKINKDLTKLLSLMYMVWLFGDAVYMSLFARRQHTVIYSTAVYLLSVCNTV